MDTTFHVQLCLVLFAAGNSLAAPVHGQDEFVAATARLMAKNTLDYNDRCSFEDENSRFALGVKMLDMVYEMNFTQMSNIASEMNQLARSSNRNFCNSIKNLQCTSDGICGCAIGEVMGMSVRSIRENGACRLTAGSDCAPTSSLSEVGTNKPDLKCQAGSECIHIRDKSPCTEIGMQNELVDSYGGAHRVRNDPKGFMGHTKNKMAEGICVCSGEPSTESPLGMNRAAPQNGSTGITMMTSLIIALFGLVLI